MVPVFLTGGCREELEGCGGVWEQVSERDGKMWWCFLSGCWRNERSHGDGVWKQVAGERIVQFLTSF